MAFTGDFTDKFPKDFDAILNQLLGEFNTVEAKKKIMPDSYDKFILRESKGYYVTKSTSGFFPDKKSPAYKLCQLFQSLNSVVNGKADNSQVKNALTECQKYFEEARFDMTDLLARDKPCVVLRRDKGVTPNRYNERLATLYDMAGDLSQQHKVDVAKSMIYTAMFNCAMAASIMDIDPYNFSKAEQEKALEDADLALKKALKNLS